MKSASETVETDVEKYLVSEVQKLAGRAFKLTGTRGITDRLTMFKYGLLYFVETKKPEDSYTGSQQKFKHRILRNYGQTVFICHTKAEVDEFILRVRFDLNKAKKLHETATTS